MQTHNNLKTIPCWHCKTPTRVGIEAVRVICGDCVQDGRTFGHKPLHVAPREPESIEPAAPGMLAAV